MAPTVVWQMAMSFFCWRCGVGIRMFLRQGGEPLVVFVVESERKEPDGVVGVAKADGFTVHASVPCRHLGVYEGRYLRGNEIPFLTTKLPYQRYHHERLTVDVEGHGEQANLGRVDAHPFEPPIKIGLEHEQLFPREQIGHLLEECTPVSVTWVNDGSVQGCKLLLLVGMVETGSCDINH